MLKILFFAMPRFSRGLSLLALQFHFGAGQCLLMFRSCDDDEEDDDAGDDGGTGDVELQTNNLKARNREPYTLSPRPQAYLSVDP